MNVWKGQKYIMITLPNGYSEPYHKYVINKKLNVPNGWSIHHLKSKNNNKFQNLLPLPNDVHIGVHRGEEEAIQIAEQMKEIKDSNLDLFQKIMDSFVTAEWGVKMNVNNLIELEKAWERLSTRAEYAEMYSIESDEFQTIFRDFITSVNDIDNYIMEESGFDWDKPFIDWSDVEPVYDWFKECLTQ